MNIKNPMFSIVMVNYNGSRYLEDAINSILNQSCQNFELIIVDGGSTDESVEIIKKYESKLAWWVSEKDQGQSDAFNKGFARARGEFYFWVNADDLLLPNTLMYASKTIKRNSNHKWFTSNTIFIDGHSKVLNCARGLKWFDFFIKNGHIYVPGPTSIFHKSLYNEVGGFDEKLNYTMDTDLWMRFKNKGYKFKRIHSYSWCRRLHTDSKTAHSFSGEPNQDYEKEQIFISRKNAHYYKKVGLFKQRLLKIISGVYVRSKIDTYSWRGKKLSEINF